MRSRPLDQISGELGDVEFRIDRRARRISIAVCHARRRVVLTAPSERTRRAAYAFLESRVDWARDELSRLPEPRPFAPGADILLRGELVRLLAMDGRGPARFDGQNNAVLVPGQPDAFSGRVRRFLRAEAMADLTAALERHCAVLKRPAPPVTLRDTRSRWGSCTADGSLSFSWRLICAPSFVLDHVAAHEAAHLVHMDHGARFHALERRLCPDTDTATEWLNRHGALLHAVGAQS